MIHTLDSPKIGQRLDADTPEAGIDVLIEVKLSSETAKAGAAAEEVPALVEVIRACPRLRLSGLMTMPPWSEDAEQSRPDFRAAARVGRRERVAASVDGDVARPGSGD